MKKMRKKLEEADFTAWSDRVERHLLQSIVILAVLLAVSQTLLQFGSLRQLLTTTDGWEGIPYKPYQHR